MNNNSDLVTVAIAPRACRHCGRIFLCMPSSISYYCGVACRSFGDTPHIKQPEQIFKMVTINTNAIKIKRNADRYGASINIDW